MLYIIKNKYYSCIGSTTIFELDNNGNLLKKIMIYNNKIRYIKVNVIFDEFRSLISEQQVKYFYSHFRTLNCIIISSMRCQFFRQVERRTNDKDLKQK